MEFWRLSPIKFDAIYRRHAQAREHLELLAGIVASVMANFSMGAPKKALRPSDFGLGPKPKTARASASSLTDADRVHELRKYFRGLAGKPGEAEKQTIAPSDPEI
jgi:hypothetical protein